MVQSKTALLLAFTTTLAACVETTSDNQVAGALIGGTLGAVTAYALDADQSWIVLGALAGAAAGTLIARNAETGDCAYANGDGTYYRAPCP